MAAASGAVRCERGRSRETATDHHPQRCNHGPGRASNSGHGEERRGQRRRRSEQRVEMAMTSQRPQASGGPKPKPEQRVVSYIASSQAPGSDDETSVARLAGIGKRNEQRGSSCSLTHLTSPHLTSPPSTLDLLSHARLASSARPLFALRRPRSCCAPRLADKLSTVQSGR
jgi:hypothetical protein